MDKEYRFIGKLGRHINWNSLIPPLLDTWFAVSASKDMKSGEIVVRVIEEPEIKPDVPPHCEFSASTPLLCDGGPVRNSEPFSNHYFCKRCGKCTFSNCTNLASVNWYQHSPRAPSALNAIEHPDVQALMKKVTEQQLEIVRYRDLAETLNGRLDESLGFVSDMRRSIDNAKLALRKIAALPIRWESSASTLKLACEAAKGALNELER